MATERSTKRRRVSPVRAGGEERQGSGLKSFLQSASNWSLEDNYQERSRKRNKKVVKKDKVSDRLPIRAADGLMHAAPVEPSQEDEQPSGSDSDEEEEAVEVDDKAKHNGNGADKKADKKALKEKKPIVPEMEQIRLAKTELAKLALTLNENPEENASAFKQLAEVSQQYTSTTVQKMCLATQLSVYKDVIPGYRIRAHGEEAPGEKISSDVRRLRAYEQSLLAGYQGFLKELFRLSKYHPGDSSFQKHLRGKKRLQAIRSAQSVADAALSCACALLGAVPHFNFREDLLRIVVGKLSNKRVDGAFVRCREAVETLFREDEEGRPSMEATAMLAKMLKARDYMVDESVPNTFLHLRLLSEFAGTGSQDTVEATSKKPKEKKEFRTKRERKQLKEQRALQRDLAQADALVAHEERERMQSETLKLVFATYFRILKLRTPHLMGAVLEGLAKYAHLINQDFFGDLLEALKDLVRHSEEDAAREAKATDDSDDDDEDDDEEDDDFAVSRNPSREALLCTVTAFALLAGQDAHNARSDLHLDLSFFTTNLFRGLFPLALSADIEKRANSLQQKLADAAQQQEAREDATGPMPVVQASQNKINLQTTTVLLIRSLTAVLLPSYNIRSVPPLRLAAFTKQLMTAALHVPEKSSQALLALLHDVANTHGKKINALWNSEERRGDGSFNPLSETVEGSNPFATTVWEGELLRKHFCPKVREGVRSLEKNLPA